MSDALDDFLQGKKNGCDDWRMIIEDMLSSGDYQYAEPMLVSILDFIDDAGTITDKQIDAVNNIKKRPRDHGFGN